MLPSQECDDERLEGSRDGLRPGEDRQTQPRLPGSARGLRARPQAPAAPAERAKPNPTCLSLSSISLLRADTSSLGIIALQPLRRSLPPRPARHCRAAMMGAAARTGHAQRALPPS